MPSDNQSSYIRRQAQLTDILKNAGFSSLILNAGPSLTYLTGLHFHISERPVVVFFIPDRVPIIVLPELEKQKLQHLSYVIQNYSYGDNPSTWEAVFDQAIKSAQLSGGKNGIEPRQLRYLEFKLLVHAASHTDFTPADEFIAHLRMHKDEDELNRMRTAVRIAEQALVATLPSIHVGITELQLASELTLQLYKAGSDPAMPFTPIVSGGPHSANPHATPTDRPLSRGDLLVIDWGASHDGYISDITRTFAIGEVDPEYQHIAQIVLDANTAGRLAVKPGVTAETIDIAARSTIESAGYAQFFTHRTGHGIGMEGHEAPYIFTGNPLILEPGMTFTVEPGIYLPGRNGVRIEDNVVVADEGSECLTSLPRELIQVA